MIHSALEDGEDDEFIELHNPGTASVRLNKWSFGEGITFTFPDVSLPPGEFLVVARNAAKVSEARHLERGGTSLEGSRTGREDRLDDRGDYVDSVAYADSASGPTRRMASGGARRSWRPVRERTRQLRASALPSLNYQKLGRRSS